MKSISDRYVGNIVVLLTTLTYFDFFGFKIFNNKILLLAQAAVLGLLIVLIAIRIIYKPVYFTKMFFGWPIILLILGIIPGIFMAKIYHDQPIIISLYGSRFILFYLLYFFLHYYHVDINFIIRMIVSIALFVTVLFYLQYFLYPTKILNIAIVESRGTIRLFVPGLLCVQAAFFYFLNGFFERNNLKDLILAMLLFSVFVAQGTRQLIFSLMFLTIVYLIFSKRVQSRIVITVLISFSIVILYMIFRSIFVELNEISSSQAQNIGEDIRVEAAGFFLGPFMPSNWAYIFGNGEPSHGSVYELKAFLYASRYGYYISDLGLLGDYIKYGLIFVLAGLVVLKRAIFMRISHSYLFLKYYIFTQCFTLIGGKGIFSGVDVVLVLAIYVFEIDQLEQENLEKAPENSPYPLET